MSRAVAPEPGPSYPAVSQRSRIQFRVSKNRINYQNKDQTMNPNFGSNIFGGESPGTKTNADLSSGFGSSLWGLLWPLFWIPRASARDDGPRGRGLRKPPRATRPKLLARDAGRLARLQTQGMRVCQAPDKTSRTDPEPSGTQTRKLNIF